jgi:hypothetical protein
MSNPHPFYRFFPAWNTGFYPQNQVSSNQLNDFYVELLAWLPGNVAGKTISQFYADVRALVKPYNEFPVFGNFTTTIIKIPDTPNWEYDINILDVDLSALDSNQVVTINGTFDPITQIVNGGNANVFNVGSYSGTFDTAEVPAEDNGVNALSIANDYGSAIFPLYYSYDSITGFATSGLARASTLQLSSNGTISRLPDDTLPKLNARRFTLPALSAEDKFAITFMEQLISTSLADTSYLAIQDTYNAYVMPEGWTKSYVFNSVGYQRIQVTLSSGGSRVFALVGRLDGSWTWQRFVNDIGSDLTSEFITTYSSSTQLPYQPTSGSRYIYINTWYDFDLCDFSSDCYVSPEFYAMPAIPGDIFQFNVPSDTGNLTGLSSVKVGLFSESGQFVQQIGNASLTPIVITGLGMYGYNDVRFTYADWYDEYYTPEYTVNFQMTDCDGNVLGDVLASIPVSGLTTGDFSEFKSVVEGLAWPDYLSVVVEPDDDGNVVFTYTLTSTPICFCSITAWTYYEGSGETVYFIKPAIYEQAATPSQFYATCTIPAVKDGCYRLGLYDIIEDQPYLYSLSNIINIDRADCFSTMLEFWSDDNTMAQGFEYFNGWKQRVRLGINGGGAKPVIEENLYRQSNGVHKRPQNKQDLSLDLHTDFLDQYTQLALVDATRHAYLVWDMKPIFVKGDIDVATIQDFTTQSSFETLAQVKFQALLQGFQPRNSSCLTC